MCSRASQGTCIAPLGFPRHVFVHEVAQTVVAGSASFAGWGVVKDTGWLNSSYQEGLSQPYGQLQNRESPRFRLGADRETSSGQSLGADCRSRASWLSDAHHPQRGHPWRGVSCRHPHSRKVERFSPGGGAGPGGWTGASTPGAACIPQAHVKFSEQLFPRFRCRSLPRRSLQEEG